MTTERDVGYVPALALVVLRQALLAEGSEQVRRATADLEARLDAGAGDLRDRLAVATARAEEAQRQVNAAARDAASAHTAAAHAVLTERTRIIDQLRTDARTAARPWAGAYRHIANQLETQGQPT